jgi:hypothetical protein
LLFTCFASFCKPLGIGLLPPFILGMAPGVWVVFIAVVVVFLTNAVAARADQSKKWEAYNTNRLVLIGIKENNNTQILLDFRHN